MIRIANLPGRMCGRCFRPAVTTIDRQTFLRQVFGLRPQRVSACGVCLADVIKQRRGRR